MTDFTIRTSWAVEGFFYTFTLMPKAALSDTTTIRWEIAPRGTSPVSADDFAALTGTLTFAPDDVDARPVSVRALHDDTEEDKEHFYLRVYQVVPEGDDELLIERQGGLFEKPVLDEFFTALENEAAKPPVALDDKPSSFRITYTTNAEPLAENADTAAGVWVASVAIVDDSFGTNTVTLGGADSALFEIRRGNEIWLKSGTTLDYETKAAYALTVAVDGTGEGKAPAPQDFTLNIGDVDENVPVIIGGDLTGSLTTDDDLPWRNKLTVSGTLEVTGGDEGTTLNFEDTTYVRGLLRNGNITFELEGIYGTMEIDPSDNSWSYEVDKRDTQVVDLRAGERVADTFTFKAGETLQDVVITVIGDNSAPEARRSYVETVVENDGFMVFELSTRLFWDQEDDRLTITIDEDELPSGLVYVELEDNWYTNYILFGTPTEAGIFEVAATAHDIHGAEASTTFTINVLEQPEGGASASPASADLVNFLYAIAEDSTSTDPDVL